MIGPSLFSDSLAPHPALLNPAARSGHLVAIPGGASGPLAGDRRRDLRVLVARGLSVFATVRPSEVAALLLLTLNVLLLLGSYYLLKTAREPLILQGGAAVKTYASAAQALLLIPVAHLFGVLAGRLSRLRLMAAVTGFFVSNLLVFWGLQRAGVAIGVPFYIWVGVFNMAVIAQFWTYVSDIYNVEQGRRLLAVIGVGAALGGLLGARLAKRIYALVGVGGLFLIAAGLLLVALGLTALADRRFRGPRLVTAAAPEPTAPVGERASGVQLLLGDRYLQLIAGLIVVLNLVNTTGEYIMDRTLVAQAQAQSAVPVGVFIASFKGDFFSWVNGLGLLLQLVVVSRVMKYLGVGAGLYVLPLVALGGYGTLAIAPVLSVVFLAKVAENGLDYSLQSTLRQALYLPTSRAAKYRAKPLIDTFVVRSGDVLASLLVLLGQWLAFSTGTFALVNASFTLIWLVLVRRISARHAALTTPAMATPRRAPAAAAA
jgi:AAA family ATP:ADP antiporter